MLRFRPVTRDEAVAWIRCGHRHHKVAPAGWLFAIGLIDAPAPEPPADLLGVAIVGRPVSRHLDDGRTAEVLRLAVVAPREGGPEFGCSRLYEACCKAAKAIGYDRMFTYTLAEEGGASLRLSGWTCDGDAGGGDWSATRATSGTPDLLRLMTGEANPSPTGKKVRWSRILTR